MNERRQATAIGETKFYSFNTKGESRSPEFQKREYEMQKQEAAKNQYLDRDFRDFNDYKSRE